MTAHQILDAVRTLSQSLDEAPLEVLEEANGLVHDYFLAVIDETQRSMQKAGQQRVVGILWAEIEMALSSRRESA